MQIPFFYTEAFEAASKTLVLDEDTSRHVVQVLRMQEGQKLNLTDGKGNLLTCEISDAHKKHCTVRIQNSAFRIQNPKRVTIAISLLKNTSRFEWFLEKATEIGVNEIVPLICERTEKQRFRSDRMKQITVSAMLQSQQTWLPVLQEPIKYIEFIKFTGGSSEGKKLIAHCDEGNKQAFTNQLVNQSTNQLIIIGPEGDFTQSEINLALENNFIPVSLGETRLRTETAGVVAATLLKLIN